MAAAVVAVYAVMQVADAVLTGLRANSAVADLHSRRPVAEFYALGQGGAVIDAPTEKSRAPGRCGIPMPLVAVPGARSRLCSIKDNAVRRLMLTPSAAPTLQAQVRRVLASTILPAIERLIGESEFENVSAKQIRSEAIRDASDLSAHGLAHHLSAELLWQWREQAAAQMDDRIDIKPCHRDVTTNVTMPLPALKHVLKRRIDVRPLADFGAVGGGVL